MKPGQPRTGVSMIVEERGRVLLIRRGREPSRGLWSLPGGRQEFGETLEQAARRELAEETGLVAHSLSFLRVVEPMRRSTDGDVEMHYVLAVFRVDGFTGTAVAGDDAEALAWVEPGGFPEAEMTEGTAALIRSLTGKVPPEK